MPFLSLPNPCLNSHSEQELILAVNDIKYHSIRELSTLSIYLHVHGLTFPSCRYFDDCI